MSFVRKKKGDFARYQDQTKFESQLKGKQHQEISPICDSQQSTPKYQNKLVYRSKNSSKMDGFSHKLEITKINYAETTRETVILLSCNC